MSLLTAPIQTVPIGRATVGGQSLDVMAHPEFTRFLFDLMRRVGGVSGWSVDDLRNAPDSVSTAEVDALAAALESVRMHSEVAELRALVAELSKTDIEGQLAQLREQVAYMGLRRKRSFQGAITLGVGTASGNFSISPAAGSLLFCDLTHLGADTAAGGTLADSFVSLSYTTTTITATRGATNVSTTVRFQFTEYEQ